MILARHLGVQQFGVFSSALSIITILSLLSGFGISQSWLKHFGIEGWNALRWLKPSFSLIIISVVIVLLILFLWIFFGPHGNMTQHILLVMSFFAMGQTVIELVSVKLQLEEKYPQLALWQLLPNLLRLIIISIMIFLFSKTLDALDVAYIYAFVAILFILAGLYQLKRMKFFLKLKGHGKKVLNIIKQPTIKEALSHSWAFGLGSIFAFIYLQSDIIMVKYISGDEQAGLYNVSFTIITAILIFPTVFYQKFLMPKVHRWANNNKNKFYNNYKKGNIFMLISGITVLILLYLLSTFLILTLFGQEYINSIKILKILALSLPFYFVAYNIGTTMTTNEHMKEKVKLMGLIAILNITLNLFFIPLYQANGAAITTVLSNIVLFLLYSRYANKNVFQPIKEKYNVANN